MKRANSKTRKNRLISLIIAMMFVMSCFPMFIVQTLAADFQTDSLNNRANTSGTAAATTIKVDSESATTNLVVKLTAKGETVTIYKVAAINYDTVTKKYSDPYWVPAVSNWLSAYDTYSTNGTIKTAYATPKNLSSASQSTWTEFYKYLLYNRDSRGPLNVIEYGSSSEEVDGNTVFSGKLEPYTDSITLANDAETFEVTFDNLELGIYAVMVKADAKRFTPVVKDLTPRVNGPEGNYYVDSVYFAELKAADATIDKKLNGKQADAVRIGEVVDFDIDITLPTLYSDRITYTRAMDQIYSMYIEDYMSQSFTLYDANNDGVADEKDVSFTTTGSTPGSVKEPFPTSNFDYYEIADSSYDRSGLTADVDYFVLTDDNIADYTSGCTHVSDLEGYENGQTYYAIKVSAPVYTLDPVRTKTNSDNRDCTYLKLNINVGVLKQMIKEDPEGRSFDSAIVTMSYKAIITDNVEVNSENNYNTATIVYEGTSGISDTVRGYSYGLQVIKVDGDTDAPIAGAQFNIYKEVNTYKKINDEYVWQADMSGSDSDRLGLTYQQVKEDIEEKEEESIYYTYEETKSESGTTEAGVEYDEGDVLAYVFTKYTAGYINGVAQFNGSLTSVASEAGVTVTGLDEGNYILMETRAPSGYNSLAEDILFTINRIDDETAQLEFNGSLCGFYDGYDNSKQLIENGIISLRVLNYKGLTLPSTGGIGILLFTVIGISIMSSALVLMVVRQRRMDSSSYM
ncbi:SpaA isopeptide-forming pilin-related protein [Pseudobutyrivibrio xylanivorans]|uniref:LPXTG-motif cell wall anchor domain-containing protein n=1 Tax=Pseudobutyrivibrio xylanivorans DSM 14809 TaxID=1123012 RepID=A0A1M6BAT6_PSEXY|nr:SpaA isopeptide-forming pilin-related protein [Pseudobutyrivibrio xylanivorans]SHI45553.1 LPXTG-motif cell wall anchor domain-containing protein [Pseudobutyrivibrio xylanivorans DSM 14809]